MKRSPASSLTLLVSIGLLTIAMFMFSGCATPWKIPSAPRNLPQDHYNKKETIVSEPKIVKIIAPISGEEIQVHIGESVKKTYETTVDRVPEKPTFTQKIWGLFGWWIILIGLVVLFVPGGMTFFILLIGRARKSLGIVLKSSQSAFKQSTKGIERFLQSDADEKSKKILLNALSGEMSNETKILVTKVKRDDTV